MIPLYSSTPWPLVRLRDCGRVVAGGTPSTETPEYWGGPILWATPTDLSSLRVPVLADTAKKLTDAGLRNSSAEMLPAGAVLFSSRAPIGLVAIAGMGLCTNQGFKSVVPGPDLFSGYLYWALRQFGASIASRAPGTTFKEVNKAMMEEVAVPLPPLPEQRRIAAILDKADAVRRKRAEALRLTDDFLRSAFLDMFGDPVTNPKEWPVSSLGDVAHFVGGGTPSRDRPAFYTGPVCWATSKDMIGEQLTDTQEHITHEAIEASATKLVRPGTILVVVKSKVLLHRLPVLLTKVPACFGQDLKGIVVGPNLDPRYVARHLRLGQAALLGQARGVNTEGLTLEHLRRYQLMLPAQRLISAYVLLEERVIAESQIQTASARAADHLFHSLVQRAFRGEL